MVKTLRPGTYVAEAAAAREACGARGVVLITYQGRIGDGLDVEGPMEMILTLPRRLRELADQIQEQLAGDDDQVFQPTPGGKG